MSPRLGHFVRLSFLLVLALNHVALGDDLKYSVSWVGNSFSGKDRWVLQDVAGLFVDADGTLFTNVPWDEAGGNVEEFRGGKLLGAAFHTHGWGYEGGEAVAANSKYLFIAQNVNNEGGGLKGDSWPAKGLGWSGVSRRPRGEIQKAAPFVGGHGREGDVLHGAFLPVIEFPQSRSCKIRGLWATESRLYVGDPLAGAVHVYDCESMRRIASWKFDRPDRICADRDGNLWVLRRPASAEPWRALCLTQDGEPRPGSIEFAAGVVPTALCVDSRNRLLVADAGPDQQIKIFEKLDQSPAPAGTLGARGGIFAGPVSGAFGDLRFNKPTGVGADSAGNIYVASSGSVSGGGTVLECYGPDNRLVWRFMGLTFVDLPALDPASETDLYTKEEHFTLDYSKSAGGEWAYRGYTVNPKKYPDDPRLHTSPTNALVRRVDGRKLLFVTDMTGEYLHVYRFDATSDGETAIPCALFGSRRPGPRDYPPHLQAAGPWLWLDRNANGSMDAEEFAPDDDPDRGGAQSPDDAGSVWSTNGRTIRCLPITGLDAHGVPAWDFSKTVHYPRPLELDEVRRVHYRADSDAMLLGGNAKDDHNQHWKPMGPVLCCYDHWKTPDRRLRWQAILPYARGSAGHESAEPISFDVAGDYVFVAYTRGLAAEGLKWAFVKVYRLADGSPVGNLTCEKQLGETGLLDLIESLRAARRADGEYVVLLEDDAKAKVVMFRWRP